MGSENELVSLFSLASWRVVLRELRLQGQGTPKGDQRKLATDRKIFSTSFEKGKEKHVSSSPNEFAS